ncbi:hypothetical protein SAMN05880558_1039 [Aeromonas sp. RU39B]|nr:hypothetical protein SAMN05880558_1039 [Aeromonas sp. RU39B]
MTAVVSRWSLTDANSSKEPRFGGAQFLQGWTHGVQLVTIAQMILPEVGTCFGALNEQGTQGSAGFAGTRED